MKDKHQMVCKDAADPSWFIDLLSEIRFGAVEDLVVRGGEPCPEPPPRVIRERRFGERRAPVPRERSGTGEFKLQVRQCLEALSELGDGVVARLEVSDGLPFKMVTVSGASVTQKTGGTQCTC